MSKSILIVEDEKDLLDYLREILVSERYSVHTANTGLKARNLFFKLNPDVVLLDLNLPDLDGYTLLQEFKDQANTAIPQVIILTADNDPMTIAKHLKSGADDYISKPFTSDELIARIYARLRDNETEDNNLGVGNIVMDTAKMEVRISSELIELTHTEFELLRYLLENKNRVLTREMILSRVWSSDPDIETRVVDVYIGYLRKKIDTSQKKFIHSKRGYGYIIKE